MPSRLPTTTDQRAAHLARQGEAIATARREAGFSQPAAARMLGIPVWTLRSWETGLRACPAAVRHRVVAEWGGNAELLGPGADRCPHCGHKK